MRWDVLIVPGISAFEKTENQETPTFCMRMLGLACHLVLGLVLEAY